MHFNNQKFGYRLQSSSLFFLSPRGGHGRKKILVDFHSYGYETAILPLVRPMRKRRANKQNFAQVLPWENWCSLPRAGISILK